MTQQINMINFHPVELPANLSIKPVKDKKSEEPLENIKDTCLVSYEGDIKNILLENISDNPENNKTGEVPLTGNPVIDNLIKSGKIKKKN